MYHSFSITTFQPNLEICCNRGYCPGGYSLKISRSAVFFFLSSTNDSCRDTSIWSPALLGQVTRVLYIPQVPIFILFSRLKYSPIVLPIKKKNKAVR